MDSGDNIKGLPGKGKAYVKTILEDCPIEEVPGRILNAYIQDLGSEQGIKSFYSTYLTLLILDKYEGFVVPEPLEIDYKGELKD